MQFSIKQWLDYAEETLEQSDSPNIDAQVLLGYVLDKDRSYFFTWPEKIIEPRQIEQLEKLLVRRKNGEPIAHLTGLQEFWSLPLLCDNSTLIPRSDTEILIETLLERLEHQLSDSLQLLDLGCGTGAIGLAIKSECPNWQIMACDYSKQAVKLAKKNVERLVAQKFINEPVVLFNGSWLDAIADKSIDIIVSNPPYIVPNDPHLEQGDVRFEPLSALVAQKNGLADIIQIAQQAAKCLTNRGYLFIEHGYHQKIEVQNILLSAGFEQIETVKDYGGNDRITLGRLKMSQ